MGEGCEVQPVKQGWRSRQRPDKDRQRGISSLKIHFQDLNTNTVPVHNDRVLKITCMLSYNI